MDFTIIAPPFDATLALSSLGAHPRTTTRRLLQRRAMPASTDEEVAQTHHARGRALEAFSVRMLVMRVFFALALGITIVGARADAHHSFGAHYFEDQIVSIEGEITEFRY